MKAYLIADISVTDPKGFAAYREQVPAVLARYGGKFLVRAGAVHPLEGDLGLARLVVIEFPSYQAALDCYRSQEYAKAIAQRQASADADLIVAEGYDGPQP